MQIIVSGQSQLALLLLVLSVIAKHPESQTYTALQFLITVKYLK